MLRLLIQQKCSHNANRFKICAPCGQKIVCGNRSIKTFAISSKHSELIKQHLSDKFDSSNEKFPVTIWNSCRCTLQKIREGKSVFALPNMPKYEEILLLGMW